MYEEIAASSEGGRRAGRRLVLGGLAAGLIAAAAVVSLGPTSVQAGTGSLLSDSSPIVPVAQSPAAFADAGTPAASVAGPVEPAVVDITTTFVSGGGSGTAAGTGIILTSMGEVLTNNHVVEGATSITVQVPSSGATYRASV